MPGTVTIDQALLTNERKVCVYIFCAALAMHIIYLSQYAKSPFFWVPELDPLFHDQAAQQIVSGHAPSGVFFRAPGYYYLLAGIYKVFGHSFWAARIVQACVGSASCVLTYILGKWMFRPLVGLIAAGTMALYGPLIFADGELHTPVTEVFLDLAAVLLIFRASKTQKPLDWLYAGLVLGLSAIVRPNILVVLLPVLWLIFQTPAKSKRDSCIVSAIYLAGAFFMPAVATVRNYFTAHDPVFIASQGGINLYLGNRPDADGFTPSTPWRYRFDGPYQDSVALFGQKASEDTEHRQLSASESQHYWMRQVVGFWKSDTKEALSLTGKKIVLAFTHQEIRNNIAFDYVRQEWAPSLWFSCIGFWFAGPLGILGMALAFKRGQFERFMTGFVLIYFASFIAFFVADRYRLPMIPFLLIFAAYSVVHLYQGLASKQFRVLAPALASLAGLFVFVNVNWFQTVTPKTWAADYWSAGVRYEKLRNYSDAELQDGKAIALDPNNPDILSSLGETKYYQREFGDAAAIFGQSIQKSPDNPSGYYNLALCCEQLGNLKDAQAYLTRAVKIDPTYSVGKIELASVDQSLSNRPAVSSLSANHG